MLSFIATDKVVGACSAWLSHWHKNHTYEGVPTCAIIIESDEPIVAKSEHVNWLMVPCTIKLFQKVIFMTMFCVINMVDSYLLFHLHQFRSYLRIKCKLYPIIMAGFVTCPHKLSWMLNMFETFLRTNHFCKEASLILLVFKVTHCNGVECTKLSYLLDTAQLEEILLVIGDRSK